MKTASGSTRLLAVSTLVLLVPVVGLAQGTSDVNAPSRVASFQQTNVPPEVQQAEVTVEATARRFRLGVDAGVGLDPELLMFGAHGTFGPLFNRNVDIRPGIEFGLGEVTTMFGINVDVLYSSRRRSRGTMDALCRCRTELRAQSSRLRLRRGCGRRCGRRESLRLQ